MVKANVKNNTVSALLHLFLFYLDELVRQMAVNCAERGLLLFRVGEEIKTTVSTYKTLYESSIAFGIRKTLLLEKGKADVEKRVTHLNYLTRCVIESLEHKEIPFLSYSASRKRVFKGRQSKINDILECSPGIKAYF